MVKMSKASSWWGLFSLVYVLLKGWSIRELHAENHFYVQISIELKIQCARFVLDGFAWFTIQQRENFLGYLVVFVVVFFLYVNPFVSYSCFYRTRSIVRNRYTYHREKKWAAWSSLRIISLTLVNLLWIRKECNTFTMDITQQNCSKCNACDLVQSFARCKIIVFSDTMLVFVMHNCCELRR